MTSTERQKYIEGLHHLADLLDTDPDLPVPSNPDFSFFVYTLAEAIHLRDTMTKPAVFMDTDPHFPASIRGTLAGFSVSVYVAAEAHPIQAPVVPARLNPLLEQNPEMSRVAQRQALLTKVASS